MNKIYIYDITNKKIDSSLINELPSNIQQRISKYKVQHDYVISMYAWYILANKLLCDFNIDIKKYEIKENHYHKPYIQDIYFNIAHSNNLIVVMISHNECGIDIEMINDKLNHKLLSNKILSLDEYDEYAKSLDKQDYITMQWSKKEAYFKCNSTGIIISELSNIDTSNIKTTKINDGLNNKYYLSYSHDSIIEIIKECI